MNTKDKKYKEYLKLLEKLNENYKAQKNLGYKPLEKPIHHGYDAFFILRDDIQRRVDVNVFQYILDNFSKSVWSRRKDFKYYSHKYKKYIKLNPSIRNINESEYGKLHESIKKYFIEFEEKYWGGIRKIYTCVVPSHFFKIKIVKSYKTHYKVIDSVLKQEESYLEDKLYSDFYNLQAYHGNAPKRYTQLCNRRDRRNTKIEIKKTMNNNNWDEMELPGRHKHYATWYYW